MWASAAAIPGARVVADEDSTQAAAFGAFVSGQTLAYDARGRLAFSGGVTAARPRRRQRRSRRPRRAAGGRDTCHSAHAGVRLLPAARRGGKAGGARETIMTNHPELKRLSLRRTESDLRRGAATDRGPNRSPVRRADGRPVGLRRGRRVPAVPAHVGRAHERDPSPRLGRGVPRRRDQLAPDSGPPRSTGRSRPANGDGWSTPGG